MRNGYFLLFLSLSLGLAGCPPGETPTDDMGEAPPDMATPSPDGPGDDAGPRPTCTDQLKNGNETDVDCGGSCDKCALGKGCKISLDCDSNLCTGGKCVAPSCMDGILNGDETGLDCGGSCMRACRGTEGCKKDADCESKRCTAGKCEWPGCNDQIQNGSETDVDCGGGACVKCGAAKKCKVDGDCATKVCDPQTSLCVGCGDGKLNGTESDVDCGGKLCATCGNGRKCLVDSDCDSRLCNGGTCAACQQDLDCVSKLCMNGVCSLAPIVGQFGGQIFFKVQVNGVMSDTNVMNACKGASLGTPCQGPPGCKVNDNLCVETKEVNCGSPMLSLSQAICNGQSPNACPALYGVYQYMGQVLGGSSQGAEQGQWPVDGARQSNRYALCVK